MTPNLTFKAGARALETLSQHGLRPGDVRAIVGASGAAKWLGVCGLDQAIFGHWLPSTPHGPIDLVGTSIGTFKLVAACQPKPVDALAQLAEAYIAQRYTAAPSPAEVAEETARIIDITLPDSGQAVLSHPTFRLHTGAVYCHRGLAKDSVGAQKRALVAAFLLNLVSRRWLAAYATRTVFSDPRSDWELANDDRVPGRQIPLNSGNLVDAVTASGALPVYMNAVKDIAGAPSGVYRDGGLLDYHPVPASMFTPRDDGGLTVYPHFFGSVTQGWFDKFLPWRRVDPDKLENVLLISPSDTYVSTLPGGRLPDRSDFKLDNTVRQQRWRQALAASSSLGEEFLRCVDDKSALLKRIEPLG